MNLTNKKVKFLQSFRSNPCTHTTNTNPMYCIVSGHKVANSLAKWSVSSPFVHPHRYTHSNSPFFLCKRPEASNLQKKNPTNTVFPGSDHTMHYLNFRSREGGINLNFNSHLIHPCLVSKWCVWGTLCLERIISWEDNAASLQCSKQKFLRCCWYFVVSGRNNF